MGSTHQSRSSSTIGSMKTNQNYGRYKHWNHQNNAIISFNNLCLGHRTGEAPPEAAHRAPRAEECNQGCIPREQRGGGAHCEYQIAGIHKSRARGSNGGRGRKIEIGDHRYLINIFSSWSILNSSHRLCCTGSINNYNYQVEAASRGSSGGPLNQPIFY